MSDSLQKRQFKYGLRVAVWSVVTIWLAFFYHRLFFIDIRSWGIYPRAGWSLHDIFTAPLAHGDIYHLISNTFPLFVSMGIIFYFYRRVAWRAFLTIYLLTGVGMWLFADLLFDGTRAYHIGASGVIYGLVAFIFWTGIFRRNFRSIILALVVLFLFQGMFAGISPALEAEQISWEGHLVGALAGILVAWLLRRSAEPEETPHRYAYEDEPVGESTPFLDPDTFNQTPGQRRDRSALDKWWFDDTSNTGGGQ